MVALRVASPCRSSSPLPTVCSLLTRLMKCRPDAAIMTPLPVSLPISVMVIKDRSSSPANSAAEKRWMSVPDVARIVSIRGSAV